MSIGELHYPQLEVCQSEFSSNKRKKSERQRCFTYDVILGKHGITDVYSYVTKVLIFVINLFGYWKWCKTGSSLISIVDTIVESYTNYESLFNSWFNLESYK